MLQQTRRLGPMQAQCIPSTLCNANMLMKHAGAAAVLLDVAARQKRQKRFVSQVFLTCTSAMQDAYSIMRPICATGKQTLAPGTT